MCGSKNKQEPDCLPITFPHFEPGLILTSDDKDPNNGNLFGKEGGVQNRARRKWRHSGQHMIIPLQLCPGNSPKFSSDTLTSSSLALISHTHCGLDAVERAP